MRSGFFFILLLVFLHIRLSAQTPDIIINSIMPNQSAFCVGDSVTLNFTTVNFSGSNTFIARMSKSGFASDSTTIGNITFTGNQVSANVVYRFQALDADANSGYQIRIRSGATASTLFPATPFFVNARPVAVASLSTQTVCSGVATSAISFSTSNNIANTTYSWSRNNTTNVSGPVSGNGDIPATALVNNTLANQTVTYTIIPSGPAPSSCAGNPITTTVIVKPAPTLTFLYADTACSGIGFNLTVSSNIPSSYLWFAEDNPFTSDEDINTQTSNTFRDTITNLTAVDQVVAYHVIAISSIGGCLSQDETGYMVISPRPVVTNDTLATVCSGTPLAIPLTSDVASTFTWMATANASVTGESTTPQTSDTISNTLVNTTTVTQTVVYTLTPTIIGGCSGNPLTLSVRVYPNPVAAFTIANPVAQCEGANSFHFTATQNAAITSYDWFFGSLSPANDTGAMVTETFIGTGDSIPVILFTATSDGCQNWMQRTISIYPSPDAAFTLSDTTPCSGDTVYFAHPDTANTSSLVWAWGDGSPSTTCTACTEGKHRYTSSAFPSARNMQLIAVSAKGCRDTSAVSINVKPKPNADFLVNDNTQCFNGGNQLFILTDHSTIADSLNNLPVYSWGFGDNSPLEAAKDAVHIYALPDSYFVYHVLTSPFGCRDSISKLLIVYPDPHSQIHNNHSDTLCGETQITLTADSGYTYLWSNTKTTRSITVRDSVLASSYVAAYTVTVTDNRQCTAVATADITINPSFAAPVIAYDTALTFCAGAKAQLFQIANPVNAVYTWTTLPSSTTYTGTQFNIDLPNIPGDTFSIRVLAIENATGCSNRDTATIYLSASQAPTATIVRDMLTLICTNNSVSQYQWGYDDVSLQEHAITGETFQSYYAGADPDFAVSGKYYWVKISDAGGCQSKVYYQAPPYYFTGIATQSDEIIIHVYPNPSASVFKIEIPNNTNQAMAVEVCNPSGQLIFREAYRDNMLIDAGKWSDGIYLLKITSANGVYKTQRIIKM
jgi:hypothetical protein